MKKYTLLVFIFSIFHISSFSQIDEIAWQADSAFLLSKTRGKTPNHFEIKFIGGYAARLAKVPEDAGPGEISLYDDLREGKYINGAVTYIINNRFGFGARYSHFWSSGSGTLPYIISDDETADLSVSLNVSIDFLGAQGKLMMPLAKGKYLFGFGFSLGKIFYKEKGNINGVFTSSYGTTLGTGFGVDFIYYVSNNLGITANLDLLGGSIKEYDSTLGDYTEHIKLEVEDINNVGHILLGAGLVLKL